MKFFLVNQMENFADVSAREHGSNKMVASKSCALSLVRQLFHFKVIEAFTGAKKKKKDNEVCRNCEILQKNLPQCMRVVYELSVLTTNNCDTNAKARVCGQHKMENFISCSESST
jgi:hypothetical protein